MALGNPSLQYVKFQDLYFGIRVGCEWGLAFVRTPIGHRMSRHRWAGQLHFGT